MKESKFLSGMPFTNKDNIEIGKFVRIGNLLVISDNTKDRHDSLITESGLGAGDKAKFLIVAGMLRNANSFRGDAGYISISVDKREIYLSGRSETLCLPANIAARNHTVLLLNRLSPDFDIISFGK